MPKSNCAKLTFSLIEDHVDHNHPLRSNEKPNEMLHQAMTATFAWLWIQSMNLIGA